MTVLDAPGLLRAVGLLADGPVVWGRPVRAPRPGVFVVELAPPAATAPIELTRIGKWVERFPGMRIDGRPATSRAVAARLAAFWIPSTSVLYVGASTGSVAARVASIDRTVLGDRRPHAGGHWLKTIAGLERARIWWAATDAVEEYEDALFGAFAMAVPAVDRERLHDPSSLMPWANLRTTAGERKAHGLSGYLAVEDAATPAPTPRIVHLAPGAADGASGLPPTRAAGGTTRRAPRPTSGATPTLGTRPGRATRPTPPRPEPIYLSAEGIERLRAEHRELTEVRRPEVIGRIKAAKELGDLKENADYTAAREEQSFLEGRIGTIETLLRDATLIEAPGAAADGRIDLGSRISVEEASAPGEVTVYELVGTAEADPGAGRISNASPVGRALVGRRVGETVTVRTPRGEVEYRIVAVE